MRPTRPTAGLGLEALDDRTLPAIDPLTGLDTSLLSGFDLPTFGSFDFGPPDTSLFGGLDFGGFDPALLGGFDTSFFGGVDPTLFGGLGFGGIDPSLFGGFDLSVFGGFDPSLFGGFDLSGFGLGGFDPSLFGGFDPSLFGGFGGIDLGFGAAFADPFAFGLGGFDPFAFTGFNPTAFSFPATDIISLVGVADIDLSSFDLFGLGGFGGVNLNDLVGLPALLGLNGFGLTDSSTGALAINPGDGAGGGFPVGGLPSGGSGFVLPGTIPDFSTPSADFSAIAAFYQQTEAANAANGFTGGFTL